MFIGVHPCFREFIGFLKVLDGILSGAVTRLRTRLLIPPYMRGTLCSLSLRSLGGSNFSAMPETMVIRRRHAAMIFVLPDLFLPAPLRAHTACWCHRLFELMSSKTLRATLW